MATRKRDIRVEIDGKKWCIIPCIKKEMTSSDYGLILWPGQFAMVEWKFDSGAKRRYPVEVLRCLCDPDTGRIMFEGLLFDRASDARLKGCEVSGRMTFKDVIMTQDKQILSTESVVGEAQVIFDDKRYAELEERESLASRFVCTRRLRRRGDALMVTPLEKLTPKQEFQSHLWGSKGSVMPSHIGVLNLVEVRLQVSKTFCSVFKNRRAIGSKWS
jgi:hypothetical protein